MAKVDLNLDVMLATVKPVVGVKYARKLVQDSLKAKGIYNSTIYYEGETKGEMLFHISNPLYMFIQSVGAYYGVRRHG